MANRRDNQFLWNPHNRATLLDCSFVVNSTDTAGLGITGLNASGRIASVYMHTSATAAAGNPNPQSGIIVVNLDDNYNRFLSHSASISAPLSGSSISISGSSVLSVGNIYVITALGTSTQANWEAVGLPASVTAAVGVSFIASVTGGGTGTGTVQAPAAAASGVNHIEVIGDPNLMNSNGAYVAGASQGMQILLGCYKAGSSLAMNSYTPAGTNSAPALTMNSYTPAGTNNGSTPPIFTGTPAVLTGSVAAPTFTGAAATLTGTVTTANALVAPANSSIIRLCLYMNNSAFGV
jgi:hypothetical protein